jgi:hypothetical protein
MTRDFNIPGEALVRVRFGQHISGNLNLLPTNVEVSGQDVPVPGTSFRPQTAYPVNPGTGNLYDLGLAVKEVRVTQSFLHEDLNTDDYGKIPVDVLWRGSTCNVNMTLIHYEPTVLDVCMSESMGGVNAVNLGQNLDPAGLMQPFGTPLGAFLGPAASGNHFISLNILSPVMLWPYRFPFSYLSETPAVTPLGVGVQLVELNWRAIPYQVPLGEPEEQQISDDEIGFAQPAVLWSGEIISSGAVLWDHVTDT